MIGENETMDLDFYPGRIHVDAELRSIEGINHLIKLLEIARTTMPQPPDLDYGAAFKGLNLHEGHLNNPTVVPLKGEIS
jgi:hypothetical protein